MRSYRPEVYSFYELSRKIYDVPNRLSVSVIRHLKTLLYAKEWLLVPERDSKIGVLMDGDIVRWGTLENFLQTKIC